MATKKTERKFGFICNNSGCPVILSTSLHFKTDEKGSNCPFCGFEIVKNDENSEFVAKTQITMTADNVGM